jgi:hypothetical protein
VTALNEIVAVNVHCVGEGVGVGVGVGELVGVGVGVGVTNPQSKDASNANPSQGFVVVGVGKQVPV